MVIENEEGTAKSEYLIYVQEFIDDVLKVIAKNDPPVFIAVFTIIIFFMLAYITYSLRGIVQYVCSMIENLFKYLHNIIIFKLYMKHKDKHISDNECKENDKKIDKKIEKNIIDLFQWKEKRQEQRDTPAFRSDSAFKKLSQRHRHKNDKKNGD